MELHAELDRCVMCGLCSQHCPTYALTADENESPRGRIALTSALSQGQLTINDKLASHLEHCTLCRACENACPSGVHFGFIMDQAEAIIVQQRPPSHQGKYLQDILAEPEQTRRLGRWLERYQRWGIQRFLRATGLLTLTGLKQRDSLLPPIQHSPASPIYSPSIGEHRGDVALFTGCVSSIVDREALNASRLLLNHLGYGVHTPDDQTCCGALHQHGGQLDKANELAQTNLAVFNTLDIKAIIHTSTGCTSQLQEYTPAFNSEVKDINQFLLEHGWSGDLSFHPLPKRLAVHEPCSARNVLHVADTTYRLLSAIPDIEPIALPDNAQCCGAAGSQLLNPSPIALHLRQNKLEALSKLENEGTGIYTLVTTNIGCALHLTAGLRTQGKKLEVLHPVTLLYRQLKKTQTGTSSLYVEQSIR
jgi:glycolate oxidase iron-sulfur subunit